METIFTFTDHRQADINFGIWIYNHIFSGYLLPPHAYFSPPEQIAPWTNDEKSAIKKLETKII